MAAYDVAAQSRLLADGLALLEAAGADRRELVAFRAGHFAANNDTWRAMRRGRTLALLEPQSLLPRAGVRHPLAHARPTPCSPPAEGVWELPVSNFLEAGGGYRHLQVTAISFAEMRHFLETARRLRIPEVTVVTHCFEFFFVDSPAGKLGHPNWINIRAGSSCAGFLRDAGRTSRSRPCGALARGCAPPRPARGLSPVAATGPAGRRSLALRAGSPSRRSSGCRPD